MLVKTFGSAVYGVNAKTITVECNVGGGGGAQEVKYFVVGLPDSAVRECLLRIETVCKEIGYKMPRQRIIINMAPADIRKEGSAYDLTCAMAILASSEQITADNFDKYIMMGELSMDGNLRPIKGALPIAIQARAEGFKGFILPMENAREAAIVNNLEVHGVTHIQEVIDFFDKGMPLARTVVDTRAEFEYSQDNYEYDFSDVKGQENIKRSLTIAAAGGHNVILIGPPGAGKTMLAKRLPTILPPLTLNEALETTKIHSVAGKMTANHGLLTTRPFRSPHHTISDVALVGGGTTAQPGEISLSHNGVLFLDELPEFKRTVLEVLRQPMEERVITISRAKFSVEYPASFMLIASMNPCPCGYYNHPEKECVCPPAAVEKYLNKISGPLLDRIDLHVEVTPVSFNELSSTRTTQHSADVREEVIKARAIQTERYKNDKGIHSNAQMSSNMIKQYCAITTAGQTLLKTAMERLGLSARAYDRILKVARTIADLSASPDIKPEHLAEAIQFRSLDKESWVK